MSARILVADDDLWILRMIATVLERRGHQVTLASDGEEALNHALASPPDLVITDVNMPRMDGWEMISAMRNQDDLKEVPVIILSEVQDEDSRVRGYRLGVEDYVAKPFRFEELDLRVARILRRVRPDDDDVLRGRAESDAGLGPNIGLVGTIEQVGLSSLMTLLELDRKTGILTVTREVGGEVEEGRISIVGGRCHAAEIANASEPRDAECIYALLAWTGGRFEFDRQEVTIEDRIGRSTTGLLLEAARLADENQR